MIINDCNLYKPILDAYTINNESYSSGKADYTPSNIMMGAKEYWFGKKNRNPNATVSDGWSAFIGTLIHIGFEQLLQQYTGKGEYILERRLELNFHNKIIGGGFDGVYIPEDKQNILLFDYKTLQGKQFIDKDKIEEWTIKANIYKYLLEKVEGILIERLAYIGVWRDWKKSAYITNQDLKPTQEVLLDIWSNNAIEEYLISRINHIESYKDTPLTEIPYCNNAERWNKKREWKVGKATAQGVVAKALPKMSFFTPEEANAALLERLAKKPKEVLGIKKTGGDSIKCRHYCNARQQCDFLTKYPSGELED